MVGQYPTRHARPTRLPHRRRSAARRESHPTQPRMTEVGRAGPRPRASLSRVGWPRQWRGCVRQGRTDKRFAYLAIKTPRKALDWLSEIGFSVIRSQLGDNDVVDHAEVRRRQAVVSTCLKE